MKTLSATLVAFVLVGCGSNPEAASPEGTSQEAASAAPAETAAPSAEATPASPSASAAPAPTATSAAAPAKTKKIALTDAGLPLALEGPEDAKVEKSQSKDGLGGAVVEAKSLSVRVFKADARMSTTAAAKTTLKKLVKPAKSFTKEDKDLLVYTRGENELSFVVLKKVGAVTYVCQSLGSAASEGELEGAIGACRSLDKSP